MSNKSRKKLFLLIFIVLITAISFPKISTIFASEILNNWISQSSFPTGLASHQAVVYNDRVYSFGGGSSASSEIYSATINSNGDFSNWTTVGNIPRSLLYHQVAINGNNLYLLGGSDSSITSQSAVYMATINSDGSLSSWIVLTPLPTPLSIGGVSIYNNKIYYIAGGTQISGSMSRKSSVYYADINSDGTLSSWSSTLSLPSNRVAFGTLQIENKIFIFGGTTDLVSNSNDVLIGNINSDGLVDSWTNSNSLPVGLHRPISVKTDDTVYIMGGRSNSGFSNKTYYSKINGTNLGEWFTSSVNLPTNNCCAPSVNYNNNIYILGGHDGNSYFSTVYKNTTLQSIVLTPTPTPVVTSTPVPTPTFTVPPSLTPSPTPIANILSVHDVKQYSSPWGSQTYDSANLWSSNPTINRWGCALTSASMVLKYWGRDVNPDQLNNWLKSQVDGYIGNGLVNWLAISRYTKLNGSDFMPTLEYRRLTNSFENIKREVDNNSPSILKLPGHFVVAKGYDQNQIFINDPATTQNSLNYYGNSYLALNQFKPSHTNLSYILLTINPQYSISVFDNSNVKVGDYYIDEPIIDAVNGVDTSGEYLGIYLLPAPEDGIYRVEITGLQGSYKLNSYIYNTDGEVTPQIFEGLSGVGQKDLIQIQISGETSTTTAKITITDVINDWNNAHNQGNIKSKTFYRSVKALLLTAKKYINKKKYSQAKSVLIQARNQVQLFTPLNIDTKTSEVIISELNSLINSL